MLVCKVIAILVIVLAIKAKESHDDDHRAFSNRVKTYLKKICNKNTTIDDLNKSLENYEKARTCFKKKFPKHTSDDDQNLKEKCKEAVEEITECIRMLLNTMKPCLDKEEEYLPNFISEAYEGYAESFCEHSDLIKIPNIFENGIIQCINRFTKYKDTNPQYVCFDLVKFSNHSDNTPTTKKELCNDLDNLYTCYELHYKQYCKESPKAWEFEGGLLDGMRKPCKEKQTKP